MFGSGPTNASVDSRERFYATVFIGFGIAWIWAARQSPIPGAMMWVLAGIVLLSGIEQETISVLLVSSGAALAAGRRGGYRTGSAACVFLAPPAPARRLPRRAM